MWPDVQIRCASVNRNGYSRFVMFISSRHLSEEVKSMWVFKELASDQFCISLPILHAWAEATGALMSCF